VCGVIGLTDTTMHPINSNQEDWNIVVIVAGSPALGPNDLWEIKSFTSTRRTTLTFCSFSAWILWACCLFAYFKDAWLLVFGWVARQKMESHKEGIRVHLPGMLKSLWHLQIFPNLRIHNGIWSVVSLEALLQVGRSTYPLLATAIKSNQLKSLPQKLIRC